MFDPCFLYLEDYAPARLPASIERDECVVWETLRPAVATETQPAA
jgi:hypothetical protein